MVIIGDTHLTLHPSHVFAVSPRDTRPDQSGHGGLRCGIMMPMLQIHRLLRGKCRSHVLSRQVCCVLYRLDGGSMLSTLFIDR